MPVRRHLVHSMIWSIVLSTSAMLACKPEQEKPTTAAKQVEEKSPTDSVAEPREAEQNSPQSAAVVEEKLVPPGEAMLAETLVAEARDVAAAMDAASTALDANNVETAKEQLSKATTVLAQIEAKRPTVNVAVELWRKRQELGVEELAGAVDTIPLLVTVSRVDVPVYSREQIQARHEQRKAQAPASVSTEEKLADLRVVDSNLIYFEVDLPIAASEIAVVEAQRLLDQNKPAEAKAALMRGIESANVVEFVVEAPEFQARQLIWDAEDTFLRGEDDDAKQLLAKANELLAPLAEREDDPQAKLMVTTLLDEMRPLQDALAAGTHDEEQASVFRRLSHRALSLARRAALRSKLNHHHEQERFALVDALMWMESAKSESSLRPDSHMVIRDLETADAALAKAIEAAPSSAKPNLEDVHARVGHILELDRTTPRDPEKVQAELANTIFELRMLMLDLHAMPMHHEHRPTQG